MGRCIKLIKPAYICIHLYFSFSYKRLQNKVLNSVYVICALYSSSLDLHLREASFKCF